VRHHLRVGVQQRIRILADMHIGCFNGLRMCGGTVTLRARPLLVVSTRVWPSLRVTARLTRTSSQPAPMSLRRSSVTSP
jgi:hypothetical protein